MKHAVLIFFITLGAYLLTASGHIYSPDEEIMFRTTQSLYEDHDLAIESLRGFATRKGTDGNQYAQYGIGQPLLAVPLYALFKSIAPKVGLVTWKRLGGFSPLEPNGMRPYNLDSQEIATRFGVSFFNILLGSVAAAILYLLLIELTNHRGAAVFSTLLYSLGSLAWAHSRPFFSEASATFFVLLSWYALARALRGNLFVWTAVAGSTAGYAFLIRLDSVVLYPAIAILMLAPVRKAAKSPGRAAGAYLAFSIPALLCLGVVMALNSRHFGAPFQLGYSDQPEGVKFATPLLAGLYGFLFSAGKGMFFFSPGLILGLFGFGVMWREERSLAIATIATILIPLLFMAKWQNWAGGWCWGPRHIFMIHPFLAIPMAFWLKDRWGPVRKSVAGGLLAIGIGVQLFACSQSFMEYHIVYFRAFTGKNLSPLYDENDEIYWRQYLRILRRPDIRTEWQEIPLRFLPSPIQDSLYIPQATMWAGYAQMFRDTKTIDNIWVRLIDGPSASDYQPAPETAADGGKEPLP